MTRTVRSSATVTTSPGFTGLATVSTLRELTRTWPSAISFAASERVFTTRANQSHLSRRWRARPAGGDGRSVKPRQPSFLRSSSSFSAMSLAKGELGSG